MRAGLSGSGVESGELGEHFGKHSLMTGGSADALITLVCPSGAESAPISHGETAYRAYRVHKASDVWLVDVPVDVARYLMWNGGFYPYEAKAFS